jgi:hypothetical protein
MTLTSCKPPSCNVSTTKSEAVPLEQNSNSRYNGSVATACQLSPNPNLAYKPLERGLQGNASGLSEYPRNIGYHRRQF